MKTKRLLSIIGFSFVGYCVSGAYKAGVMYAFWGLIGLVLFMVRDIFFDL